MFLGLSRLDQTKENRAEPMPSESEGIGDSTSEQRSLSSPGTNGQPRPQHSYGGQIRAVCGQISAPAPKVAEARLLRLCAVYSAAEQVVAVVPHLTAPNKIAL